jgi:PAS domain S-box-containing protein
VARSLPSVNRLLGLLALACVVPVTALFLVALAWSYETQRAELTSHTIATARALMFGVDERLHSVALGLANLAQARALADGDLPAFRERAAALAATLPVRSITLVDAEGRQLVNTRVDPEALDPRALHPKPPGPADLAVPRVLDLFHTPVQQRSMVGVALPVKVRDREGQTLIANIDPVDLETILRRERLPAGWIAAVLDSRGVIVGRTLEHDRFVGTPARAPLVARIQEVPEDAVESMTVDGVPVITAFSRSPSTGWSIAIGMPLAALTAPLERALWLFAGVSVLVLLATFTLSQRLASRISGPLHALAAEARSVGHGPIDTHHAAFAEAEQLAQGLLHADAVMRDAQEARERAEALLRSVSDATPEAMVGVDEQERIVLFNGEAERLFGVGADDVAGVPLRRILPRATGELLEGAAGGGALEIPMRALSWEGEPFMVEARVSTSEGEHPVCTLVLRERTDATQPMAA